MSVRYNLWGSLSRDKAGATVKLCSLSSLNAHVWQAHLGAFGILFSSPASSFGKSYMSFRMQQYM